MWRPRRTASRSRSCVSPRPPPSHGSRWTMTSGCACSRAAWCSSMTTARPSSRCAPARRSSSRAASASGPSFRTAAPSTCPSACPPSARTAASARTAPTRRSRSGSRRCTARRRRRPPTTPSPRRSTTCASGRCGRRRRPRARRTSRPRSRSTATSRMRPPCPRGSSRRPTTFTRPSRATGSACASRAARCGAAASSCATSRRCPWVTRLWATTGATGCARTSWAASRRRRSTPSSRWCATGPRMSASRE
mmetsp:Transcript_48496/g.134447  ORF Transcript_48496/g.134447 Transcript_48496/m.134447 type:complete len:250 (+) Transcript_48496:84-833(+)